MNKLKIGVLASGRGSNLEAIINEIKSSFLDKIDLRIVISDNKDAKALEIAKKNGFDTMFIDCGPKSSKISKEAVEIIINNLKNKEVELIVLAGFMRIVPKKIIDSFDGNIINIHPSLLPSFPGLHAQKQALDYGVKISGCTVHFVDTTIDGGPIILQECVNIDDEDDEETLAAKILKKEHKILPLALKYLSEGKIKKNGRKIIINKSE